MATKTKPMGPDAQRKATAARRKAAAQPAAVTRQPLTDAPPPPPFKSDNLTPLEFHALATLAKQAPKLRDLLAVGAAQPVDFCIHVSGAVSVGEKQQQPVEQKPTAADLLAVALDALDPNEWPRIRRAIERTFADFRETGKAPDLPAAAEIKAIELAQAVVYRGSREVRGNVTGEIRAEVIARPRRRRAS